MYAVEFVGDDALPAGHDFMLVQTPEGAIVYMKQSAITQETIESSWAAYRAVIGLGGGVSPDPEREIPDRSLGTLVVCPESRAWVESHLQLVS